MRAVSVSPDALVVTSGFWQTNAVALRAGDEAVLIGSQDGERILCEEVARRLGTINYEVTCGLSPRVRRRYTGSP